MVENGKRDIVDPNTLAIEPFNYECSFRAVDFSYIPYINETVIEGLLDELCVLIDAGHISPIHMHAITTFGFDDVIAALSYNKSANYAAANSFLDAFASYRRSLGLNAITFDLNLLEDVGYLAEQDTSLEVRTEEGSRREADEADHAIKQFRLLHISGADTVKLNTSCLEMVAAQFGRILRLETEPEPGPSLVAYGLDFLAAVEFRNWMRMKLEIELTTLDITSAPSLIAPCEKLVEKLQGLV
ncbi:hypothetical protein VPNG_01480 [Cytospora leucostoma]|uniref:Polyketide synthase-like phosphopantetheine-binding domain-containing protein n=1 Tax=Cytospora leucostoma TaxID=1230097 RepID=A0A423XJL3_9PEZI|nr:hypothetical protein VPNG_01480 [Cytospora leucostoma]